MYRGSKGGIERPLVSEDPGITLDMRERHWQLQAKAALTITDMKEVWFAGQPSPVPLPPDRIDYAAPAMRRLFDHFKLDPNDPWSWRWLVHLFAYAEFWERPKKPRGRPKEWTDARNADLAAAVASLPSQSSARAARKLANDAKSPFARKTVSTSSGSGLRRRIARLKAKSKAGT
jgi:hypothetical protein